MVVLMDSESFPVFEYVSSLQSSPGLLDLVANIEEENEEEEGMKKYLYSPHMSMEQMRLEIKVVLFFIVNEVMGQILDKLQSNHELVVISFQLGNKYILP